MVKEIVGSEINGYLNQFSAMNDQMRNEVYQALMDLGRDRADRDQAIKE